MIGLPFVACVNHLLRGEPSAQARLAPFAGKQIRVIAAPLPELCFSVREGGLLDEAAAAGTSDCTITLAPAALPGLLRRDEAVLRGITFTGDAELAAALQFLFRNLRWDVEEDLA